MGRKGIICHNALKAQIDTHLKTIGMIMHEMEIYVNRILQKDDFIGTCFVPYVHDTGEVCDTGENLKCFISEH